jgi:hypothetical protein
MSVIKRLGFLVPVLAALVMVAGSPRPASAEDCSAQLGSCYGQAANAGGSWAMWMAGLDCEVSFADCVRSAIFSY